MMKSNVPGPQPTSSILAGRIDGTTFSNSSTTDGPNSSAEIAIVEAKVSVALLSPPKAARVNSRIEGSGFPFFKTMSNREKDSLSESSREKYGEKL